MMRIFGLFVLTMIIASAAFAQRQHRVQTNAEKEVLAFLDRLTEAGLKRDVKALNSLYSDTYFHTNGDGSIMTKAQVLDSYKAAPPAATIESDQHDEERVSLIGKVAYVNMRVTIKGRIGPDPYLRQWRISYLCEKTKSEWHAVSSHATLILQRAN